MSVSKIGGVFFVIVVMVGCSPVSTPLVDGGHRDGGGGAVDGGPVGSGESKTVTIGADGGVVSVGCHSLSVPAGALVSNVQITLTETTQPTPDGFQAYSPLVRVAPASAQLSQPATLSLCFTGNSSLATIFESNATGVGYERMGGLVSGATISTPIAGFGDAFVANGVQYVDPADRSCARLELLGTRLPNSDAGATELSSVALMFRAEDCQGRPLVGLTESDFVVKEDETQLSVEASKVILPARGLQVFATLLLDLSSSTQANLQQVTAGAKLFVTQVQGGTLRVPVGIRLFAGDRYSTEWQAPTLDTETLLERLDEVPNFVPADPSATNLYGAVIDAVGRSAEVQADYRARNAEGVFTAGYIVLFTDGTDTTGYETQNDAGWAIARSSDTMLAVALDTGDFTPVALDALKFLTSVPNGVPLDAGEVSFPLRSDNVVVSSSPERLTADFGSIANRIAGLSSGSYLLGYCSPKRTGTHAVAIEVANAVTERRAESSFNANGFGPGCDSSWFSTACDGKQCGGLACGSCDDRTSFCNGATLQCDSFCSTPPLHCGEQTFTNPQSYEQACPDTNVVSSCGDAICHDLQREAANCGTCGNSCPTGATCTSGACQCPANQTLCNGVCTITTPANCCGVVCSGSTPVCESGVCTVDREWSLWAGPTPTAPNRFSADVDTVFDAQTGLTWQRVVPSSSYSQADAIGYCDGLVLGGSSDWRVPKRIELISIVDVGKYSPSIDTTAFPATPSDDFWSSSLYAYLTSNGWAVDFNYGLSGYSHAATNNYRVRCVH